MSDKELKMKTKAQKDYPEFTDTVDSMESAELKSLLSDYANYREETELAKKEDQELNDAKDHVANLAGPYNDTLKALKVKTGYIHLLLKDRGKASDSPEQLDSDGES